VSTDFAEEYFSEERIIQLAKTCKNTHEFIDAIESIYHEDFLLFEWVGSVLNTHSFFNFAIATWEYVLQHYVDDDDKEVQARCYVNSGMAYAVLANFPKAIENFESGLKLAKEIGYSAGESACYNGLGYYYAALANFPKAIENYESGLKLAKEIGDRTIESECYINSAFIYQALDNSPKAIENYESGLKLAKEIGDRAVESRGLGRVIESRGYMGLGVAYYNLGDYTKAIENYESGLKLAKEIGDRDGESACYNGLGYYYAALANFPKAIENFESGLKLAKEIGDRARESIGYMGLGVAYAELDNFPKAIEYSGVALKIVKDTGELAMEAALNLMLGLIYYQNNPDISHSYLSRSIDLTEMIGGRVVEEEYKVGLFSKTSEGYQHIVPLCIRLGNEEEAFEYTERSKSKALLNLLAASNIKPSVPLPANELESLLYEEENHLTRLRKAQMRHLKKTATVMTEVYDDTVDSNEKIERILLELHNVYDKIEKIDPEYVFLRRAKPLPLSKIQNTLQQVLVSRKEKVRTKLKAVIVEYFTTKDKVFIFVISPNEMHVKTVELSQERLTRYVENFVREVVNYPVFGYNIGNTWLELTSYLIEPISEYLSENDLIYFVPYGKLHYIPLHALELNGRPLIKTHAVVYSPSASLLQFYKNKGSRVLNSCSSFGVVFKEEAKGVADIFKSEPYLDATKDMVLESINSDILHFSCHGRFDMKDPLSSGIVLEHKKNGNNNNYNERDDVLTAREIFNLKINSELVTLSACQTGINEAKPGDELIGLTRSIIYAGAPSVIVSLWSVDARSTRELMLEFYKLLKNGKDKATALQQAQIKIMEKEEYSHPYYWAPFVLVGDWE
jgi:CHAT domain-containing protein